MGINVDVRSLKKNAWVIHLLAVIPSEELGIGARDFLKINFYVVFKILLILLIHQRKVLEFSYKIVCQMTQIPL